MLKHIRIKALQYFQRALFLLLLGCTCASFAADSSPSLINGVETPYPAPLLMGITAWVNSDPIKLSDMQGKVILIEFWTSSCPYCKTALPFVNKWYSRYHDKGLLIIGIHSPKNDEEQNQTLVKDAVSKYDIHYPVAMDNNFETWENYNVQGWPSFYLINKKGNVVYVSYGADRFDIIDNNIRSLLKE